jgi:hypothetical protein
MMAKWAVKEDEYWGRVRQQFADDERLGAPRVHPPKRSLRDHAYHPDDLVFPFPDDCPCEQCEHNRKLRR